MFSWIKHSRIIYILSNLIVLPAALIPSVDLISNIATIYRNKREFHKSMEYCDLSMKICVEPTFTVYLNKGHCHEQQGDMLNAWSDFRKALEKCKEEIEIRNIKNKISEV